MRAGSNRTATFASDKAYASLLMPHFWPSWLGLAILRTLALLPSALVLRLGRLMGRPMGLLMPYRKRVADTNLRLCFPELPEVKRYRLLREHFASLGLGLLEMAMAWWTPAKKLENMLADLKGSEHLASALQSGNGALLVTGHFTPFEIGGRLLADQMPLSVVYREFKNPVFNRAMLGARRRQTAKAIERSDLRTIIRTLRNNGIVWYAPDQDAGRRSVMAPFFGIPAATHRATARMARLSGAAVLPYSVRRLPGRLSYSLTIHPPLEGFPSGDEAQDAARINAFLESAIRDAPEQYLWVHRRFKTRLDSAPSLYPGRRRRATPRVSSSKSQRLHH